MESTIILHVAFSGFVLAEVEVDVLENILDVMKPTMAQINEDLKVPWSINLKSKFIQASCIKNKVDLESFCGGHCERKGSLQG